MNRHTLIHSPNKNYKYQYCDKEFTLKQYLKEHTFTHTKAKPYVYGVNDCIKRFKQTGKLSLHRRTHKEYKVRGHDCNVHFVIKDITKETKVKKSNAEAVYRLLLNYI